VTDVRRTHSRLRTLRSCALLIVVIVQLLND
jgi:hypothetical protein